MKLLLSLCAICTLLTGCAAMPQPAQDKIIKSIGDCYTKSGMDLCDITLEDGTTGYAQKGFVQVGSPIRSDMIHH